MYKEISLVLENVVGPIITVVINLFFIFFLYDTFDNNLNTISIIEMAIEQRHEQWEMTSNEMSVGYAWTIIIGFLINDEDF